MLSTWAFGGHVVGMWWAFGGHLFHYVLIINIQSHGKYTRPKVILSRDFNLAHRKFSTGYGDIHYLVSQYQQQFEKFFSYQCQYV